MTISTLMPGTVYIVGAGASYEDSKEQRLPLPLATQFFSPAYIKEHWHPISMGAKFEDSALGFVLRQYFAFVPENKTAATLSGVNVEEVYSFLDRYCSFYSPGGKRAQVIETARAELMEYIINVIRYAPWHIKRFPFYDLLVSKLQERDSILSFNWDLSLDRALKRTARGKQLLQSFEDVLLPSSLNAFHADSGKAIARLHRGVFLKLHGSVNLTICTNERCARFAHPYLWPTEEEMADSWDCDVCGSLTRVFIVPPHVHKTYGHNRFLSLQARIAAKKIDIAERIVVIGYSFPQFDFEARTMMRCARLDKEGVEESEMWLSNVTVVNPAVREKEYVTMIKSLLGIDCPTAYGHEVELTLYPSVADFLKKEPPLKKKA